MVHQKPVAFPMSIGENVLFGVRFHKNWNGRTQGEIVESCLDKVGIWGEVKDRLSEPASRLSVGQLQRYASPGHLRTIPRPSSWTSPVLPSTRYQPDGSKN